MMAGNGAEVFQSPLNGLVERINNPRLKAAARQLIQASLPLVLPEADAVPKITFKDLEQILPDYLTYCRAQRNLYRKMVVVQIFSRLTVDDLSSCEMLAREVQTSVSLRVKHQGRNHATLRIGEDDAAFYQPLRGHVSRLVVLGLQVFFSRQNVRLGVN